MIQGPWGSYGDYVQWLIEICYFNSIILIFWKIGKGKFSIWSMFVIYKTKSQNSEKWVTFNFQLIKHIRILDYLQIRQWVNKKVYSR